MICKKQCSQFFHKMNPFKRNALFCGVQVEQQAKAKAQGVADDRDKQRLYLLINLVSLKQNVFG